MSLYLDGEDLELDETTLRDDDEDEDGDEDKLDEVLILVAGLTSLAVCASRT